MFVVSADETTSKKGHPMLKLVLRAESGPDRGLHVYEYLNVGHPTESVRVMAKQKLRQLAAAVGIERAFNTAELAGKRCMATTYIDGNDDYGLTARVRSFAKSEQDQGDPNAPDMPF
jgi:hypothetical protein